MNERDMHPNFRQSDFESGQLAQSQPHPEPSVPLGRTSTNSHSNSHFEPHNGGAYYGMTPYDQPHPPTNLELRVPAIPAGSTFYNRRFNLSSGSRTYPGHVNNVSADHLPSSSNHRGNAVPTDDYAHNNLSMDGMRGSYKRKNAEVIPANTQHAGSSSSISSVSSISAIPTMDASYHMPEYRGNGPPPMIQDSQRNQGVVPGPRRDSVWTQNYNHGMQGVFMGQPFQPSGLVWMDQQSIHNSSGGGALPWNLMPSVPCYLGRNIHGAPLEVSSVGLRGYHEAAARRVPGNFMHSAPIINNIQPAPCIQGIRGFPISFHPPLPALPAGHPLSNPVQHTFLNHSSADVEASPPTSEFRTYRPHRRPDSVLRLRNMPYLSILPTDEVAILEIPGLSVAGNAIDHHSDMRMNIDDMSYEDLLALGEQIGSVHPLSDENIADHLKTRLYCSVSENINLEELPSLDQNVDLCIICQDQYQGNDRLGCLDCGHQYHHECLKKWLKLKNVCPICKSTALLM